jgi:hypothetical protein
MIGIAGMLVLWTGFGVWAAATTNASAQHAA